MTAPRRFTFLCLNLWHGGKLFDAVVDFLRRENADILALQEVYNGEDAALAPNFRSFTSLRDALRLPHGYFAPCFRDARPEGAVDSGNAVLSKFPISATNVTFFDLPYGAHRIEQRGTLSLTPRNLQRVVLDVWGTPLHVYNTQGVWDIHGDDNERRIAMCEKVAAEVRGKHHVIVAGDFNVKENTKAIRTMEGALTNVFKGARTTSFNLTHKREPGFATAVVDFVFASPDLRVLHRESPSVNVSDHLPLVCEFEYE